MKPRFIQILILLGALSVIVLFATQYFWAKELQRLENNQFNQKVQIALTNIGNRLIIMNKSKSAKINSMEKPDYNKFVVKINDHVQPALLKILVQREFNRYDIREKYQLAVYDCFTDSVVYTTAADSIVKIASKDSDVKWDITTHNFGVIFPDRAEVMNDMKI